MFTQKETESAVNVTLSANNLDETTYIARVSRSTADFENVVSDISTEYPSLDPYVISHAAELIKDQIVKYIKAGKAVNILELGTLYRRAHAVLPLRDIAQRGGYGV